MAAKAIKQTKLKEPQHKKSKSKLRFIMVTIGVTVIALILFIYFYAAFYYTSHFFNHTVINGFDSSNLTVKQAETEINAEVKAYGLVLEERNGIQDTIWGRQINLHTEFEESLSNLLARQNAFAWPVSLFKSKTIDIKTMLIYDEELLKKCFKELNCFDEGNNLSPINAAISEYGENGYEIVPEDKGAKVIEDILYDAVGKAINELSPTLNLEDVDCYEKPDITSEEPKLRAALDQMNQLAGAEITYEFGDVTEVLNGDIISQWITMDNDFNVSFNEEGVKEYVDYIGKTYNTFGKVRTFQTSYDKVIDVKGGDYGWWLNRSEETKELTELVKNGEKLTRVPVYYQTAQQYGDDDIGDTYVEVNLTAQHLFFYKEGELILESDFVSGNVSKDWGTPVGTYPVQYKDNDATLVGEDYSTPVKYWMPFNRNIGFHDAYWRDEFGKDIYLTKGSHGCINMPPAAAKKLYQDIKRGVAVVVYELKGTENYEVKESEEKVQDKNKEKAAEEPVTDSQE